MSNSKVDEINNLYKIKDFCLVGDGAHASLKRQNSGIMYLTSKNFKPTGLDLSTLDFISENDYKKYFTSSKKALTAPLAGDILFGIIGSLGVPYILKKDNIFGISSSVAILRPQPGLISKYLYYFMISPIFQGAIDAIKSGVAQSFLSLEIIRNLPLIVPKKQDQKKIAAILSAYDDLIEKSNRRIAILEKMAEEIYREWFVRLRFPGHEQVKFNKGIPEGWEVKQLDGFCQRVTDGTHDTPKPTDDGYFLITGKNLKNGIVDFEGAYKISKQDHLNISKRSGLKPGDIIFSNIGTLGSMVIVTNEIEYSVKNVIIFKPFNNNQSVFLYYMLKEKYILEQLLLYSSGASQQFISLTVARKFKILVPGQSLINLFGKYVLPLHQQKALLVRLNSKLKQTRDRLLTRLISGKLSVEDLDIQFPPSMIDTE